MLVEQLCRYRRSSIIIVPAQYFGSARWAPRLMAHCTRPHKHGTMGSIVAGTLSLMSILHDCLELLTYTVPYTLSRLPFGGALFPNNYPPRALAGVQQRSWGPLRCG